MDYRPLKRGPHQHLCDHSSWCKGGIFGASARVRLCRARPALNSVDPALTARKGKIRAREIKNAKWAKKNNGLRRRSSLSGMNMHGDSPEHSSTSPPQKGTDTGFHTPDMIVAPCREQGATIVGGCEKPRLGTPTSGQEVEGSGPETERSAQPMSTGPTEPRDVGLPRVRSCLLDTILVRKFRAQPRLRRFLVTAGADSILFGGACRKIRGGTMMIDCDSMIRWPPKTSLVATPTSLVRVLESGFLPTAWKKGKTNGPRGSGSSPSLSGGKGMQAEGAAKVGEGLTSAWRVFGEHLGQIGGKGGKIPRRKAFRVPSTERVGAPWKQVVAGSPRAFEGGDFGGLRSNIAEIEPQIEPVFVCFLLLFESRAARHARVDGVGRGQTAQLDYVRKTNTADSCGRQWQPDNAMAVGPNKLQAAGLFLAPPTKAATTSRSHSGRR